MIVSTLFLSLISMNFVFAQSTGVAGGRVTNLKTGTGISGAAVSAVGPTQKDTTTDSLGYYTISGLAPGPYTISVSASSYVDKSSSLFIYPTGTTPLNFQLSMRSIKGQVYDASTPTLAIGEANITIGGNFVLTNVSGYYEWLDLSAGTYTLTASAPGYASQSSQVTVSVGSTATADFGLNSVASGRIVGTVKDSTTRDGLPGATVRVRRGTFEKTGNTDLNGQYSIENMPAWPYWTVDAYRFGYIAQNVLASVQSGVTKTLSFELVPYGNISGTIKDLNTNQPIEGAVVKADSVYLGTTNASGHYTMFAEADTYAVTASAPGHSSNSQSNVRVTAGMTTTVNFLLQSVPLGKISGRVTDAKTASGIYGALVVADGHTNLTDANGNYLLSDMPAWSYTINVSASGFLSSSTPRTVPSGGSVTADFALSPHTRMSLEPYLNFGSIEEPFSVDLFLSDSRFVYGWEIYLWWNPSLLDAVSLVEGNFLKGPFGDRQTEFSFDEYVNEGVLHATCQSTLPIPDSGVSGSGALATLTFQIKANGSCSINITSILLSSPPPSTPTFINAIENAIFRTLQSDINNDGVVNTLDLVCMKEAYGAQLSDPEWNASADVNRNQIISASDLQKLGKDYGLSI
jgi:hypothetical protein